MQCCKENYGSVSTHDIDFIHRLRICEVPVFIFFKHNYQKNSECLLKVFSSEPKLQLDDLKKLKLLRLKVQKYVYAMFLIEV